VAAAIEMIRPSDSQKPDAEAMGSVRIDHVLLLEVCNFGLLVDHPLRDKDHAKINR
jgi:hypothetical protein